MKRANKQPAGVKRGVLERAGFPTLLALLAIVLYGRGLLLGFAGDDFLLLDSALRIPLFELLGGQHAIQGYYRPVSRELYFWWWGRVLGLGPIGFHLVNAATYAGAVVCFFLFARRLETLGARPGDIARRGSGQASRLAALALVLFPPTGALLSWVSCAQDLIALFWGLAALALHAYGRRAEAAVAAGFAMLSKETALIVAPALVALDLFANPGLPPGRRLRGLAPLVVATLAVLAIAIGVRATWPKGTAVAVWSPAQVAGAWHVPFDFLRAWWPPDLAQGLERAASEAPLLLLLCILLAALAAGFAWSAASVPARPWLLFGVALLVLGWLPITVIAERWRGYFFGFSAVGASLLAAAGLVRLGPWPARILAGVAAAVSFGSLSFYQPVESAEGPARHPHVNYAFFRDQQALTAELLASARTQCDLLSRARVAFAIGVPPEPFYQAVLGPGLRVTCHDPKLDVRFLVDFTERDARADFAVVRMDLARARVIVEPALPQTRARIGEGFLLYARPEPAAACFDAAAEAMPGAAELVYPRVISLAAARRTDDARRVWAEARRRGQTPTAELLASRFLAGGDSTADSTRRAFRELCGVLLRDPTEPEPHEWIGRRLLALGRTRAAGLELAVAWGIRRDNRNLVWLAEAYREMGSLGEAWDAYRTALTGVQEPEYSIARRRFLEMGTERPTRGDRRTPGGFPEAPTVP